MKTDPLDVLADAVDAAHSDPQVYTALDTAQHILHALTSAGFAIVRLDNCPHCGADNVGSCRRPGACRWKN